MSCEPATAVADGSAAPVIVHVTDRLERTLSERGVALGRDD